jgi:uracil phosphoribosyltransferase
VDPSQPVVCVPILRAGLVLLEQAATVLPSQITFHFGACDSLTASRCFVCPLLN